MAVLLYTGGKVGYAADALAAVLETDSDPHFEPWYALAESLMRRKDFRGALAPIEQVILRPPDHPGLRAMEAVALYGVGRKALGLSRRRRSWPGAPICHSPAISSPSCIAQRAAWTMQLRRRVRCLMRGSTCGPPCASSARWN